jgi:hypothetical protein
VGVTSASLFISRIARGRFLAIRIRIVTLKAAQRLTGEQAIDGRRRMYPSHHSAARPSRGTIESRYHGLPFVSRPGSVVRYNARPFHAE